MKGGLGNQLFQWYFAHSLLKEKFIVETASYQTENKGRSRSLEIGILSSRCSHGYFVRSIFLSFIIERIMSLMAKMWEYRNLRSLVEKFGYVREDTRSNYPSTVLGKKGVQLLDGYFQDNRKLLVVSELISQEMWPTLRKIFSDFQKRYRIPAKYEVLHVRRADFSEALKSDAHIGILDDKWYIENYPKNSDYLILLTEDAKECENLVDVIRPNLVLDSQESTAWEALAVMAFCDSGLGSNSTLSWWGARMACERGGNFILPGNWSQHGNIDDNRFLIERVRYVRPIWFK
jgi:hypothetical protein